MTLLIIVNVILVSMASISVVKAVRNQLSNERNNVLETIEKENNEIK